MQCHREEIEELPKVLADKVDLLPDVLRRSRAENTCQKYENAFIRWKNWGLSNGLGSGDILPAKALPVAIYLTSLIQTANTPSPIITTFYALKWYHGIYDLKSLTDSKTVINVLEAAKRILAKPTNKKLPMTMYKRLFEFGNIKNQRIICASLLAFAGFMRSSELLNVRLSDLIFEEKYMAIFVEGSKTDKYRDGC